ncbi:MAG: alpha/beta fold hydrolase [Pseudomonadota bacterium]
MHRHPDFWIAVVALACIFFGVWHLVGTTQGLDVRAVEVGQTPVTVFQTPSGGPRPVVVIAHGFAGSQQLMQPFAVTLARNGYLAATFDFLGHGANPLPLGGSITEETGATQYLLEELGRVVRFAIDDPASDGRLALLGHSMASDIVVRFAQAQPEVQATVAVSMFAPGVTATTPENLLIVVGAWEPALKREALRVLALAAPESGPTPGLTLGQTHDGTGRRVAFAPGAEHIGVLYSPVALDEARRWLDQVFERDSAAGVDDRRLALGALFLGLVLLARPLTGWLPVASPRPVGAGLRWRLLLPVALAPAILTPLLLWRLPTDFLPILVGDYLALHFGLYGALTALGLWLTRSRGGLPTPTVWWAFATAAALLTLYSILAFALPIDRYVTAFVPTFARMPLVLVMLAGMLPYFLADEWLTRGSGSPRFAYPLTKLCFLVSLAMAVALDLERLFFLIVIVPVIVGCFVVYGLFSSWAYRRTNHPLVAGIASATAFAWAIAVTFPFLGG